VSSEIQRRLKELICEKIPTFGSTDKIVPDSKLTECGVNSVSFVQFIIDIETAFSIEFDLDKLDINNFASFKELASYIGTLTGQ
jgi:acyl carrier protein